MECTVRSYVRGNVPRVSFAKIAEAILGKSYELSIILAGDTRARAINMRHRKKDYVPNVLAFPLTKNSGEIVLNPHISKKEAPKYNHSEKQHLTFLFIHACLHLKGLDHGVQMEKEERRYLKRFV